MSASASSLQRCPFDGCTWEARSCGHALEAHIRRQHLNEMSRGESVSEDIDNVRERQNSCPWCLRAVENPTEESSARNITRTIEPNAGVNKTGSKLRLKINAKKVHLNFQV
ncbi:hypothetical protein QIS74_12658 [Colletotrichum tabaci]|uniref:C2H2-type domain-containing protein n=1 Tax=Colletotrichum tabaci TaxID=1209068 RepID=A0AAV9SX45_9PEZI